MTEKDQALGQGGAENTDAMKEALHTDLPDERPSGDLPDGLDHPTASAEEKISPEDETVAEGRTQEEADRTPEEEISPEESSQEESAPEDANPISDVFTHEPVPEEETHADDVFEEAPLDEESPSGAQDKSEERSGQSEPETESAEESRKEAGVFDDEEDTFIPEDREPADTRLINLTGGSGTDESPENGASEGEEIFSEEPASEEKEIKTAPVKAEKGQAKPKKKRKGLLITGITLGVLALVYLIGVWRFSNAFMPNTYVDGYNAVNQSISSLEEKIGDETSKRAVTIEGADGQSLEVKASDIGFTFDKSIDFDKIIKDQNPWTWPVSFFGERRDFDSGYTYDKQKLASVISSSPFVKSANIIEAKNAEAVYDGNQFVIQEEVYGTHVNEAALQDAVITALANNQTDISLEDQKLYYQPSITKEDKTLKSSVDKLNQNLSTVITYDFGDKKETLDKNTFASWLHTDDHGNVTVDESKAAAYVEELADKYDTLYTYRPFKTSGGSTIDVFAEGYGWEIDQDEETNELISLLESGTSQEREPVYAVEGADRSLSNAVGGTYVEISIPDQTMWLYENGNRVLSTPITTGTAGQYDTPRGLYQVAYKSTNVTLRGEDYASPVTFWIPFNGGIGIHDASWRTNYGGNYYLTGGSHGCINTPYDAVATIYSAVDAGTPVVVY